MADGYDAASPDALLTVPEWSGGHQVLHWFDFLCPFCYVGQQRNTIFEHHGFTMVRLPFQAHPDIPIDGRTVGTERSRELVTYIDTEARAAGLPLVWPARLPNTRMALAAAEWVRRHASQSFPAFEQALFAAHFSLGEDLGDRAVIDLHAREAGIDIAALHTVLDNGSAYALVDQSETLGRKLGVQGTPAWFVSGRLISGLYPRKQFEQLAQALAA